MGVAAWSTLLVVVGICVAIVVVPALLLRPFSPQGPSAVWWSYVLRQHSPWITTAGAVIVVALVVRAWRRARWIARSALVLATILSLAAAWFARQNHFEWMFNPAWDARFIPVREVKDLLPEEYVIGVALRNEALAFPVRRIGYHHVVNTTLAGEPIVATYCTLCHTGLVWKRTVAGRTLTFRLIGINNQNMMMEDLETRSWWQQVSGEALTGPLKGTRLERLLHDEVSLGLWRREHPNTRVLGLIGTEERIRRGWENRVAKRPVVVETPRREGLEPRSLVFGLIVEGRAKAYPRAMLTKSSALMDQIGSTPIAILVGADGLSTRAFDRRIDGRTLELLARPGSSPARFVDAGTGSEWDIRGLAVSGPLAGRTLQRIPMHSDFWFDWHLYHPDTTVYRLWRPAAGRSS
jgi:hypothetical protein